MLLHRLFPLIAVVISAGAFASQEIDRIDASPQPATVGKPVKFTVTSKTDDTAPCGVQMDFGDGSKDAPQKVGDKWPPFPRTWEHTYSKPGKYTLTVEGARAGNIFGCVGRAHYDLFVEVAPAAAAKSGSTSACPEGWALKGKVAKNGSFTCTPAKGVQDAKAPENLDCPSGTEYFRKGKTLGCAK
ncbi:MAG: PKD domain-containing protein [Rhodocyclaceae bacterium]|nr:PKD domain-containing protein [Rhodocyclaceae bacterium]MBX3669015.1 PKD domain-containing protein [Rhodocyclaceae bacterium]